MRQRRRIREQKVAGFAWLTFSLFVVWQLDSCLIQSLSTLMEIAGNLKPKKWSFVFPPFPGLSFSWGLGRRPFNCLAELYSAVSTTFFFLLMQETKITREPYRLSKRAFKESWNLVWTCHLEPVCTRISTRIYFANDPKAFLFPITSRGHLSRQMRVGGVSIFLD